MAVALVQVVCWLSPFNTIISTSWAFLISVSQVFSVLYSVASWWVDFRMILLTHTNRSTPTDGIRSWTLRWEASTLFLTQWGELRSFIPPLAIFDTSAITRAVRRNILLKINDWFRLNHSFVVSVGIRISYAYRIFCQGYTEIILWILLHTLVYCDGTSLIVLDIWYWYLDW